MNHYRTPRLVTLEGNEPEEMGVLPIFLRIGKRIRKFAVSGIRKARKRRRKRAAAANRASILSAKRREEKAMQILIMQDRQSKKAEKERRQKNLMTLAVPATVVGALLLMRKGK